MPITKRKKRKETTLKNKPKIFRDKIKNKPKTKKPKTKKYKRKGKGDIEESTIDLNPDALEFVPQNNKRINKPLHSASSTGNINEVKKLLGRGINVNDKDENEITPLHLASWYGNEKVVQILLENGADIEATDKEGHTPLDIANRNAYSDIIDLLEEKAFESSRWRKSWAPTDESNIPSGLSMSNIGSSAAHANIAPEHGIQQYNKRINKPLIQQYKKPINKPLHWASSTDARKEVKKLLSRGVNVNDKDENGITPLHLASYKGNQAVVQFLLNAGADIEATDKEGHTPLDIAKNRDIINLLNKKAKEEEEWFKHALRLFPPPS
jgi:ankyrin repeat protein